MRRIVPLLLISILVSYPAAEELTFTTWNILNFPGSTGTARQPYFRTVLSSIGPDILVTQEILGESAVTQFLNNVLNTMEPGEWSAAPWHNSYDTDRALFYRTSVIDSVIDSGWLDTALRDIEWWLVRLPDGEEFRIYTLHLKASSGGTNEQKRLAEVEILRADLDALPSDLPFIVAGDFNIYYGNEPAYQELISSGSGQLHDPIDETGHWHDASSYAIIHTQSPRTTQFGGGANGGMDDRFDQILVSNEWLDGSGLEVLPETYLSYGNDGEHFNQSIIEGGNSAVPYAVAEGIHEASDHLPVIVTLSFPENTVVADAAPPLMPTLDVRPNPFNPTTTIHFTLAEAGHLLLNVYDSSGRRIATLADGPHSAGEFAKVWDGTNDRGEEIGSGIYFARIVSDRFSATKKMVLLR